jgi:hypothetical protein
LFYSKSRDLLEQHFHHELVRNIPAGIGGAGEVEFISKMPILNRHLIIYHGTTTFLRLGDVSFVDLETFRVAGIGELKSMKKDSKTLEVKLFVTGPQTGKLFAQAKAARRPEARSRLRQDIAERLRRQIKGIKSALGAIERKPTANSKLRVESESHYERLSVLLKDLQSKSVGAVSAGESLFLAGVRVGSGKLSDRLLAGRQVGLKRFTNMVARFVPTIMKQGDPENSLHFGSLHYSDKGQYALTKGIQPICWWPLNISLIGTLVFNEVMVFSFHNSRNLLHALRLRGYETSLEPATGILRITKSAEDRKIEVQGTEFFLNLVRKHLLDEALVVQMIEAVAGHVRQQDIQGDARIDIDFQQHFGRRPSLDPGAEN